MEMAHMALDTDSDAGVPETAPYTPNPYSCGLSLCLDARLLDMLGIEGLPTAGTTFHIEAVGVCTDSSTSDPDADGDIDQMNLRIQITHLGLEHEEEAEPERDHAMRLYGNKEG